MTHATFNIDMQRIYSVFGEKAYGNERLNLIWKFCSDLEDNQFSKIVDHFLSSARYSPLPKDFKDAATAEKSKSFTNLVNGAADTVYNKSPEKLKNYLDKDYPGCSTVWDAVKVEMFKNRIKKADEVNNNV